jgi:peptide deformylase
MTKKFFLRQPSEAATVADVAIAHDLADTLEAHRATCVGMAANMIGERKRIIAVIDDDGSVLAMMNPEITSAEDEYEAEEGCLSLTGVRTARRFRSIAVRWQNETMEWREGAFGGRVAQAIQHELDHCNGILI